MNNNTKVVFVQLEDVSHEEISVYQDFKHLLGDSPIVKWGDPGFWNKLRYFLPEPVYLTFHRNVTMRGTLQSSNLYQSVLGQQLESGVMVSRHGSNCTAECHTSNTSQPSLQQQQQQQQQQVGGVKCDQYGGTVYSLDHTYHSIDNNHIYHTLDPASGLGSSSNLYLQFQPPQQILTNNRVYINSNMDLINPQTLVSSFPRPLPIPLSNDNKAISDVAQSKSQQAGQRSFSNSHNHTNSTSSAKRLLSPEDSEYIV